MSMRVLFGLYGTILLATQPELKPPKPISWLRKLKWTKLKLSQPQILIERQSSPQWNGRIKTVEAWQVRLGLGQKAIQLLQRLGRTAPLKISQLNSRNPSHRK